MTYSKLLSVLLAACLAATCQALWADYAVQVGYYKTPHYATLAKQALSTQGYPAELQPMLNASGKPRIRLVVGPYPSRKEALTALERLKEQGREGFIVDYSVQAPPEKGPALPRGAGASAVGQEASGQGQPPAVAAGSPAAQSSGRAAKPDDERRGASENIAPTPAMPAPIDLFPDDGSVGLDSMAGKRSVLLTGFFQSEVAETLPTPEHLSKFRNTLDVSAQGRLGRAVAWKVSGRMAYDAVFDLTDYYSTAVRDDQQIERSVRETYLDISQGDWDFRLGRQQIVWSEMVGLFFADVVSAKDLREFILPDFDMLRIPQWAVRSEYFHEDFHGEAIWIPYPTYNIIGVPGGEFYPYPTPPPPGYGLIVGNERRPAGRLSDSNYGLRFSYLTGGWDLSMFYYSSMDAAATFFRQVVSSPSPAFIYTPDHTRIRQAGGTFSKDLISMVVKGEVIYTHGRWFATDSLSDADGVVRQDTLDYVLGLEYNLFRDSRLTLQFFQRWFPDHDPALTLDRFESGVSLAVSTSLLNGKLQPEFMIGNSLNRGDWMARPKLVWNVSDNWRLITGVDLFGGSRLGLFGQYDDNDRVYAELRFTY